MKVLALADIHLRGGFGTEEAEALLKCVDIAKARKVDLVLVNGDVFEAASNPEQRLVFREFLDRLVDTDPPNPSVIVLRGNHDQPRELMLWQAHHAMVSVYEVPGTEWLNNDKDFLQVLTIPHFNAGAIALEESDLGSLNDEGTSVFDRILDDYFQKVRTHEGPSLVAFHGTVSGAHLDNGHIPRENGIHLNLDRLNTLGCPVVGGHYHRCQNVASDIGGQVWYSGSLTRQTYGESEGDKGVLLFEYTGGQWAEPEFISLNPTPMMLVDAEWNSTADNDFWIARINGQPVDCSLYEARFGPVDTMNLHQFVGARVRFRYTVHQHDVATVPSREEIQAIFPNSREVKIEQVVQVATAVRCEEMTQAESVEDCFRVWAEAKGENVERVNAALTLLSCLGAETPVKNMSENIPGLFPEGQKELATHAV